MADPLLRLTDISKSYPGVRALSRVSLTVNRGEVLALIGENGAGKSTLMKILGGVVQPDQGTIEIDGVARASFTVPESLGAGIAFVHQELNLFENLDAGANVLIGREPLFGGPLKLVDRNETRRVVAPLLRRLDVDFDAEDIVSDLSLAQRQLLEIAKALSLNARVVIMDEPTSSLTSAETDRLMRVIGELKADGVAIIFITHRLNEVERCADRVVVLRDGSVVGELGRDQIHREAMIRLMIGRDLKSLYIPPKSPPGAEVLGVMGLRTPSHPRHAVSLSLKAGEILGMAGLIGAGRTELARAVFGVDAALGGEIRMNGKAVSIRSAKDAIAQGIYLVPEDRKRSGLVLEDSVAGNISLPNILSFARYLLIDFGAERKNAERQRQSLAIKAADVETVVGTLSGGNQQKVVLAKWLSMKPKVMMFDEPTRGIDVGSKSEIYTLMRELADAGVAILMISSDMEEVIGVSDRIVVMQEGTISGTLNRDQFSEENVMRLAVARGQEQSAA
ncbi:MAG TPA: sugar ABC transporter ATP-binding protein [Roseiarcus sp.]